MIPRLLLAVSFLVVSGLVQAGDFPDKYLQLHDKAATDAGALKQLQSMADKGDAIAQYCLAGLYNPSATFCKMDTLADQKVTTVKEDPKQAIKWYRKAALQGNGYAADELALMYIGVEGVPADMVQAAQWFMVAIDMDPNGGGFDAGISFGAIKGDMTPEQLDKARAAADKIEAGIKKKQQ